jgi:hypothetical protein
MPPKRKKKRKSKKKKGAGGRAAAQALLRPSPELAVLLGSRTPLTRGDAVSGLWAYAKARRLNEGRSMRCDAAMERAFGVQSLTMFQVTGALSSHLTSTGSSRAAASSSSASGSGAARPAKRARVGTGGVPPVSGAVAAERRPKPKGPVVCSALLTAVLCGGSGPTAAREMRQLTLPSVAAVTAKMQQYITAHALRVPRSNSLVRKPWELLAHAGC